jgi:hypothetical protein
MSNPSNLYAEKIFSEHPLVLWALDDKSDYVSLITEAQRNIESLWTISGATVNTDPGSGALNPPFEDSLSTSVLGTVPVGPTGNIVLISPNLNNFSSMSSSLGTFSVGSYFYSNSIYINSISIGYEYTDPSTSSVVQELETFVDPIYNKWSFLSSTFIVPDKVATFRIVIKISTASGGASSSDYQFYVNGISAGQWAEEFHATSLGTSVSTFPANIAITQDYAVEALPYGLTNVSGYYLASETALFARNTSIPLVYGASGVTKIIPNGENPSLIVPGQGFLNELGRYNEYTAEFWIRVNSDTLNPRRIFGPIASSDGIYVESGFITLKIGESFRSHFIGEWYRPMLVDIRVIKNSASLLINGEEVISLSFDTESISLPSIIEDVSEASQDWLGFYAYEDVPEIEIDCVAIYPYQVPTIVAKRRWVYGQGVESPEGINSAYAGVSAFIDYSFADYTANYSYPGFAKWQQGTFDNLVTTSTSLQTPSYVLPDIILGTKTISELYNDNKTIQSEDNNFICLKPNLDWQDIDGYFNFSSLDILNDEVHSIYMVIKVLDNVAQEQTLFYINDLSTGNKFSVIKEGLLVKYYLTYNNEEELIFTTDALSLNTKRAVGINIDKLVETFGGNIAAFFGKRQGLNLYIGGGEPGTDTFNGYIYSVGISTQFNSNQILDHFLDNGIAIITSADELFIHTASYNLLANERYGMFFLDIGVSGYWEDYLPLSYFAQYVKNDVGNEYYDLDFIQFNYDYPEPSTTTQEDVGVEGFSYIDLYNQYSSPLQQTYEDLADVAESGWQDYLEMSEQSVSADIYNTDNSEVRSYITFQYISDGANSPLSNFLTVDKPIKTKILDMDNHPEWPTTRFEVVNNTLIYPSKTIDFNELAIVYRLEFNVRGTLTKSLNLRNLSFSSQVLNNNSFNAIGTKFGNSLFPYKKAGIYYDYKSKNPFSIYKDSTPYLYMTKNSGIEVRGDFLPSIDRGISLPVNTTLASNYRISAFQTWYRNDSENFEVLPVQLFEINHKNEKIKFYVKSLNSSGSRGKIYGINDSTGEEVSGISYYINGVIVREPVITIREWSVIGISFGSSLIFDSFLGSININGPGVFNNLSYYQATNLQQIQSIVARLWTDIDSEDGTILDWQYWKDNYSWNGMLVLSSSSTYGVNPSEIYKTYIGTNKIIVDDGEGMILDSDKLKIYDAVEWSTSVVTPV